MVWYLNSWNYGIFKMDLIIDWKRRDTQMDEWGWMDRWI